MMRLSDRCCIVLAMLVRQKWLVSLKGRGSIVLVGLKGRQELDLTLDGVVF